MPGGGEARPPLTGRAIADWGRNQNPLARVPVFCDCRELLGLGGMGPGTPGCGHLQCPHCGAKPPCAPSPQIDQLRAELLQERSSRQDLECDKVSLERQVSEGPHPAHGPAGPRDPRAAASASLPLSSTSPVFARGCPTSAAKCPLPGWMQPLPLPPRAPASGRASSELSPCVAPPGSCPGCCREVLQSGAPPGLPRDPPFPHALGPQRAAPRRPLRALSPSLPNVELAGSKADQWEMSSSSPARSRGVITAAKTSTGHAPLAPRSSWGAPGPPWGEQLCYAVLLG